MGTVLACPPPRSTRGSARWGPSRTTTGRSSTAYGRRAPSASTVRVRAAQSTSSRTRASACARRASGRRRRRLPVRPRRPAAGPVLPDPRRAGSPRACAGPRASWTPARSRWTDGGWRRRRARATSCSTSCTSGRSPPRARSTRRSSSCPRCAELGVTAHRADARRRVPRRARLGLRRRLPLGRAVSLRRAARACSAWSTPPTRAGMAVRPRRRLQPRRRLGQQGAARPSGPTSRRSTRRSGARRSTSTTRTRDAVREWVLQSAEGWVRDFHVDGLRLDAIHAIYDSSAEHAACRELAGACTRADHRALVIAESGLNDPKVMRPAAQGGWGCDAAWADDFHHALRVAARPATREGYYAEFGRVGDLAKAFHRPHVHDGTYSTFRGRRFGAPADDRPRRAVRRLRPEPRPGRQPRARRPAARRGPAARRAAARCCRPSRRCCSWARSTASGRRSSSSPTTSTRRSPWPRARGAGASSPRSPRSPARRCPTRRTPPRSSARSSRATGDAGAARRCTASCSRVRRDAAAAATPTRRLRRGRALAARAPRRQRARAQLRPRRRRRAARRRRRGGPSPRTRARRLEPRASCGCRRSGRGAACDDEPRGLAGPAVPARRDVGRRGHELLAVLRARRAASSCACSTTTATRSAIERRRAHGVHTGTATCRASARASATATASTGPTTRRDGPPLQPGQAADRPVRQGDRGRGRWDAANVLPYVPDGDDDADLELDDEDDADAIPQVASSSTTSFDWEGDRAAPHAVVRDGDLRDPRQGLHEAPSGRARGPAGHLRRAGVRAGDRLPQASSASPRSSCCRSTTSPTRASCTSKG